MRKKSWDLGSTGSGVTERGQGCLWLLTWGSEHMLVSSLGPCKGKDDMRELRDRDFRRQEAHMVVGGQWRVRRLWKYGIG